MPLIQFYANLRTLTRCQSLKLDSASFPTLRAVLDELIRLFPGMDAQLLNPDGSLRQEAPIFVNGRNPRLQSAGISCMLAEDDIVSLFSPIASGRMNVEALRNKDSASVAKEA